jgi:cytochrome c oxidase subunit 2
MGGFYDKYLMEGVWLELIWTLLPGVVLIFLALPSLNLLYSMDEILHPGLTIKIVGNQWYWYYEYSDYGVPTIAYSSYMIMTQDLRYGEHRILEVDDCLICPIDTDVRVLVSAEDVIHSFSVPGLTIKVDAVPGRINVGSFRLKREGFYYGQCSEICGANHSFMPICVDGRSRSHFIS